MNSPVSDKLSDPQIAYEPYYTPQEAAAIVKCAPSTMRRFFDEHPLAIVINPGSKKLHRRLPKQALDQLLNRLKIR
jgi:hypothetical protein